MLEVSKKKLRICESLMVNKTVATVVGAVGGGYAGHQVEKHVRSTKKYEVVVRFEDGSSRVYNFDTQPSWRIGDRVKDENGALVTR